MALPEIRLSIEFFQVVGDGNELVTRGFSVCPNSSNSANNTSDFQRVDTKVKARLDQAGNLSDYFLAGRNAKAAIVLVNQQ